MGRRRIEDWTTLVVATVEIRRHGQRISKGHVDTGTTAGRVLWLHAGNQQKNVRDV